MTAPIIVRVAVPVPLRGTFDYRLPDAGNQPMPGCRVKVPFGKRELTGLVMEVTTDSKFDPDQLKTLKETIDQTPLIDTAHLEFLSWVSRYYLHPIGEVLFTALPVLLRRGHAPEVPYDPAWICTRQGYKRLEDGAGRAPLQYRVLSTIAGSAVPAGADMLKPLSPGWRNAVKTLLEGGLIEETTAAPPRGIRTTGPPPTADQQLAIDTITSGIGSFQCLLLHGITGSGKTEVYLRAIEAVLARDLQALVLVPEISLTPQLIERFEARFHCRIDVMHSGMTGRQRLHAWERARRGEASIVIGTRSAVFTPLARPGIIIVDEEHDASFKQQDGLRYHARDLAIKRARDHNIPVVLGSATPSLESYHNAQLGRYSLLTLKERATRAGMPDIHLLDMLRLPVENGISRPLRDALRRNLERGEQSLLFLNRRGFAPAVCCADCNWLAQCRRCDARLTWHRGHQRLRCHHCGLEARWPDQCPNCGGTSLVTVGQGTEHIEDTIRALLPGARIERIDRDTTRRKGELEDRLARVHSGQADILVGTQMLSKGHHFPDVTLVGVIDTDQLLFSADFRASERLFQLITQVAGRAGRADKPGIVLIQTRYPDSPWLQPVVAHDYDAFARMALDERNATAYPPYSHLALLRAEAPGQGVALAFLREMHQLAQEIPSRNVAIMDPVPSLMEKRGGRYRGQLLVQSPERKSLHRFLRLWVPAIDAAKQGRKVRWSLDVDPVDLY